MKLKTLFFVTTIFLAGLIVFSDARAQDESIGRIDWMEGFIKVVGHGAGKGGNNPAQERALALRAARADAQRVLLETVKGVRIDSQTRVDMMMVSEDVINTRVEGIVKGAQVVKQDVEWITGDDNKKYPTATVELRMCLSNASESCKTSRTLISALNLDAKNLPANAPPEQFPTIPEPAPAAGALITGPVQTTTIHDIDPTKPVTGVIINLEGRFFEREMLPVVITEGSDQKTMTVYSVKRVRPQIVRTYGVVRYADTLEQARKIAHIGENVLIVPATKVTGDNLIVIGMDAARKIKETVRFNNDYLGEAKVIISLQ